MMAGREIVKWIETMGPQAQFGIGEGGLSLVVCGSGGEEYLEIGGLEEEDEL